MGNVQTVLVTAKKLIEKPENWTRNAFARDVHGTIVLAADARATCYCAMGAVEAATASGMYAQQHVALALLECAIAERVGNSSSVPLFNDDKTTAHADVLCVFDRAIELAKKEEADE